MFCKKCGKELSEDALFCSNCGSSNDEETVSSKGTSKKVKDKREKIKPLLIKSSKLSIISTVFTLVLLVAIFFLPIFSCRIEIKDMEDIRYLQDIEDIEDLNKLMKKGYIEKKFSLFDEFKRTIEFLDSNSSSDKSSSSSAYGQYKITESDKFYLYTSLVYIAAPMLMAFFVAIDLISYISNFRKLNKSDFKISTAVSLDIVEDKGLHNQVVAFGGLFFLRLIEPMILQLMVATEDFPWLKYVRYMVCTDTESTDAAMLLVFGELIGILWGIGTIVILLKRNKLRGKIITILADE